MLKKMFFPAKYTVLAGNVEADGMVHCVNDLGTIFAWNVKQARKKAKTLIRVHQYQDYVLRVCGKKKR